MPRLRGSDNRSASDCGSLAGVSSTSPARLTKRSKQRACSTGDPVNVNCSGSKGQGAFIGRSRKCKDSGVLYRILNNRVYIGDAVHKGVSYPGEHQAIIDRKLWDQVHAILKQSPRRRAASARAQTPALLKGLLFGPDGAAMSPTHTRKAGRLYRYYISQSVMKRGTDACPVRQIPAAEIERIVIEQIRSLLQTPEIIVQTWRAARKTDRNLAESEVRGALLEFEPIWNELFPAEQARIVELLVERVDLQPDGIDLRLRIEGLTSLCSELRTSDGSQQEAA